jgi:hypothetical protein
MSRVLGYLPKKADDIVGMTCFTNMARVVVVCESSKKFVFCTENLRKIRCSIEET